MQGTLEPTEKIGLIWKQGCASCMAVKQYLNDRGIDYDSYDAGDGGAGEAKYNELGIGQFPAILRGDSVMLLLHVSQVDSVLGLTSDERKYESSRLAWDAVMILEDWVELLRQMTWEQAMTPTRNRGRTPRNLTVNVFDHFRLLPIGWETGHFQYHTEASDAALEVTITDKEMLDDYATRCLESFRSFVFEHGDEMDEADRMVHNTKSDNKVSFAVLVHAQRRHAATHHRQLVAYLRATTSIETRLNMDDIPDLDLPESLY